MNGELDTTVATAMEQPPAPTSLAEFRADPVNATESAVREAPPAAPVERRATHRAKSQRAVPEDVKEIDALTKRLREAEDAIPIERNSGESDRAYQLRKRAEIAVMATKAHSTPAAPVVARPAAAPAPVVARPPAIGEFTEKEPQLADFATDPDPYAAWQRSLARFDRRKDDFEATQKTSQAATKAQQEVFDREINECVQQHVNRIGSFMTARPDMKALFDAEAAKPEHEQIQLPIALRGAIEFHEKGPEFLAYLLQNPDFADEIFLLTDGRAVGDPRTDPLVASVRRRLLQRVPDVKTGAPATPRQTIVAPRPPTPVRTAPQTPREKAPTEPAGSLAEHRRQSKTLGLAR